MTAPSAYTLEWSVAEVRGTQVALGPPDRGIPPETDARQPFQPADQVIATPYVSQFVSHNPAPLGSIHFLKQRSWNHDPNFSARPPHQRRKVSARGEYLWRSF